MSLNDIPLWQWRMFEMSEREFFLDMTHAVNAAVAGFYEEMNTCILSSHLLAHVLSEFGYKAYVVRVKVGVFHNPSKTAVVLGIGTKGTNKGWAGHACVAVGTEWLLDPTLPQVNQIKPEAWGETEVVPLVIPLSDDFYQISNAKLGNDNTEFQIVYSLHPRPQSGFGWRMRKFSSWRKIAELVLKMVKDQYEEDAEKESEQAAWDEAAETDFGPDDYVEETDAQEVAAFRDRDAERM